MDRLKLLWVDLTISGQEAPLPPGLAEHCIVHRCGRTQPIEQQLRRGRPDAVCFDFDYPDRASLNFAAEVKRSWPSLPMILLTVQHSEALAVWAFRSRFTDYLVKPLPAGELERCLALLREICGDQRSQARRRMPSLAPPMPEETPAATGAESSLLPAVSFVENNFHTKIQSEEVARLCAMSPFRFSRTFKETFGMAFRDYVVRVRLKEARRLLENPQASITDVAYAVGFNDISYFSRMFKRHFGVSPSAMQEQRPSAPQAEPLPLVLELPPLN